MIWTIRLAKLHPEQKAIIKSPARFKVLVCGRRFGKTSIALDVICRRLIEGESVAYFAPTYRMAAEAWRKVKERLHPIIQDVREHEGRLETCTGGIFECWSLANNAAETARGRKYHYVVMDEAALFESAEVWHGAIRPLLTDYAGGALFASTPRGRNWFWQLYLRGENEDYPDWQSWRLPTLANPHISEAEVEAARQEMPERFFNQEYLAEFLDNDGVVFRNIEQVCVGTPVTTADGEATYFGVDWGKDNDFTCISVMTREGRQVWLERFRQIGWAAQRGRLAALAKRFNPVIIVAEENSIGSVNIEALKAEGLPVRGFTTTSKSKGPLIEGLVLAMEKEDVILLNDPVLRNELMAYEMTRRSSGWSYSAPAGGHDDTVIATALSLWAVEHTGRVMIDFI